MTVPSLNLEENPSIGTQADACGRNWSTDGWTDRRDEGDEYANAPKKSEIYFVSST